MVYSRRFSSGNVEPPPDYGGVTYRREEREQTAKRTDEPEEREDPSEKEFESGRADAVEEDYGRNRPYPRRPLYRDGREYDGRLVRGERGGREEREDREDRENHEKRGRKERNDRGGLLSSLFSLSGRSFSMEDILLAGMILLLLGERDNGKQPDGELLLILGLLLLGS